MVCLPVSRCQQQHFQTTLTGKRETFLRPARCVSAAQPSLPGGVIWPGPLPCPGCRCPGSPCPVPAPRARPGSRCRMAGLLGAGPGSSPPSRPAGFSPVALREPLPPSPPQLPGQPGVPSPARFQQVAVVPCCPLPAAPLEESGFLLWWCFFFFPVVGERKSASSKISEVQVHQIFLPAACYTLRESDCRAPGALLAVRGCSCFPLRGKSTSGICSRFQRFLPRLL